MGRLYCCGLSANVTTVGRSYSTRLILNDFDNYLPNIYVKYMFNTCFTHVDIFPVYTIYVISKISEKSVSEKNSIENKNLKKKKIWCNEE